MGFNLPWDEEANKHTINHSNMIWFYSIFFAKNSEVILITVTVDVIV